MCKKIKFSEQASYIIKVKGKLSDRWNSSFEGLTKEIIEDKEGIYITILTGKVKDQSELSGILNSLYNLHLPVMQVKCLKESRNKQRK